MFSVKEMKLKYIAIEIEDGHNDNNLPKINLQTELDKLCSFSSLGAVKACSVSSSVAYLLGLGCPGLSFHVFLAHVYHFFIL